LKLKPGSAFGPYRVVGLLGRGGMGAVYRAHDSALDRDVALKVLPAEFLHDAGFAERFRQEARVAARLEHPHIIPVHAFGIEAGRPWMAMRLVSGGSLAERLRRSPRLPPAQTAALLRDVAEALDHAHRHGVVHRDVKPANVLLDEGGRAYLADFGIARLLEGATAATATGLVRGTPSYMAPEQAMGGVVDHRADVYALGAMAFECLTGRVPYTGPTPAAVLLKHVQEPVPASSELPPSVSEVIRRSLAKAPEERWPSAGSFAAALEEAASGAGPGEAATVAVGTGASPRSRLLAGRLALAGLGAAGGALAVALALWLVRPGPPAAPPPSPVSPGPAVPSPTATASPAVASSTRPAPARTPTPRARAPQPRAGTGRPRVYCEARLEPTVFKKTEAKDVLDSLVDLEKALRERRNLEIVGRRDQADAVVQVLERGREPAVVGMRKVRVRVVLGRESVELVGQDSMTGFNTWSGAAKGAARQAEAWLERRLGSRAP
jgi:serine/threonine-protein kinase